MLIFTYEFVKMRFNLETENLICTFPLLETRKTTINRTGKQEKRPAGRWFSPDTLVSSINKTDHHDITEILWKVALNTIILLPICNVLHKNEDLEEDTLVRSY
jgi:hypothetical protein